jgi:hypothetical protein
MKTFLIVEEQGGGCDYTIGCGIRTTQIEADSMEEAIEFIKNESFKDRSGEDDGDYQVLATKERERCGVSVYEIGEVVEIDLAAWRKEFRAKEEAEEELEGAKKELAEYERLRKKLGQ